MAGLTDLIGGTLVQAFKSVVEEFHLSPEKKAEVETKLAELEQQSKQADRDLEAKLNDIAGQNIRTETSSNDAFVRRARPAFLWMMTIALFFNLFLPLVSQFFGGHLQPLVIDSAEYGLFSAGFLGYTAARTVEKKNGSAQ